MISKVIHCSSRLFWQMLFHSLMFYGSIYSFYLEKLMSNLKWHAFDLIQVALTLSVIISKIARIDYPREWYAFYLEVLVYNWVLWRTIFNIVFKNTKIFHVKQHGLLGKGFSDFNLMVTLAFKKCYCWFWWRVSLTFMACPMRFWASWVSQVIIERLSPWDSLTKELISLYVVCILDI